MKSEDSNFVSVAQIVGPIDRMIRGAIAYLLLIIAFTFHLSILELFGMLVATIYFFFTGLSRWDPLYALVLKLWRDYKDNASINGRF